MYFTLLLESEQIYMECPLVHKTQNCTRASLGFLNCLPVTTEAMKKKKKQIQSLSFYDQTIFVISKLTKEKGEKKIDITASL